MFSKLRFACLLSAATVAFAALGPKSTLTITNRNVSPDGSTRPASVVNGIHPGPVITAKRGDRFNINVVNHLTDPTQSRGTSIHWHGLLQRSNNFMDGAAGITQCPIAPDQSFLYSFTADRAGTFWYHSHFEIQYCDGVRGALIIYDPLDPLRFFYDVDDESTIITLSEWYHTVVNSIPGIPVADSTLINGKGRFVGGPKAELAVVNVQRGKRYRFRVISISCDPNFTFSVDGHDLTVIEVESTAVRPYTVNTIQFFSGQRYSVVLNANQPIGNYWIRALPNTGKQNLSSTFENGVNSAILRYKGAPNAEPKSSQQKSPKKLVETNLNPLALSLAPGKPTPNGADVTFNLTMSFDEAIFKFKMNDRVFVPPDVPVLLQIMSGARTAQDLLPEGSVLTVERNKVVQVNIPSALTGGPHPFHLHGHKFSVVKSADSEHFDFLNPIERDVVNSGETEGDHISIRFRTDNPGPWVLHCHIDFHFFVGLAIVFAEAPAQTPAANHPPPAWDRLCPTWDALPDSVKHVQVINSTSAA